MSEPLLSPGVDPKDVVQGVKVIEEQANKMVGAAGRMSKAFDDFGGGLAKKARPGLDALKQAMVSNVSEMSKQLEHLTSAYDKLSREQAKSVSEIERLQARLKESGKRLTKGLKDDGDEAVRTVRAQRQALQAQYEAMSNLGWKIKPTQLAKLSTSGVTLFTEDRARLEAAAGKVEAASRVMDSARLGWIAKMQTGSLKLAETVATASASE
jgi:hypothetical protein